MRRYGVTKNYQSPKPKMTHTQSQSVDMMNQLTGALSPIEFLTYVKSAKRKNGTPTFQNLPKRSNDKDIEKSSVSSNENTKEATKEKTNDKKDVFHIPSQKELLNFENETSKFLEDCRKYVKDENNGTFSNENKIIDSEIFTALLPFSSKYEQNDFFQQKIEIVNQFHLRNISSKSLIQNRKEYLLNLDKNSIENDNNISNLDDIRNESKNDHKNTTEHQGESIQNLSRNNEAPKNLLRTKNLNESEPNFPDTKKRSFGMGISRTARFHNQTMKSAKSMDSLSHNDNNNNYHSNASDESEKNEENCFYYKGKKINHILILNKSGEAKPNNKSVHFLPKKGEIIPPNAQLFDIESAKKEYKERMSRQSQYEMIQSAIMQHIREQYMAERCAYTKNVKQTKANRILSNAPERKQRTSKQTKKSNSSSITTNNNNNNNSSNNNLGSAISTKSYTINISNNSNLSSNYSSSTTKASLKSNRSKFISNFSPSTNSKSGISGITIKKQTILANPPTRRAKSPVPVDRSKDLMSRSNRYKSPPPKKTSKTEKKSPRL